MGTSQKLILSIIGTELLIARPASMSNAGEAPIVSCFDNVQHDNDSQAIDAVSGLYNERVNTQTML